MAEMNVVKNDDGNQVNLDSLSKDDLIKIVKSQANIIDKAKSTIDEMYSDIRILQNDRIGLRLDKLFKCLDYEDKFKDKEGFITDVINEIHELMVLPKKKSDGQ